MEIPLELQLKEANCRIKMHLSKWHKFQHFLSPMFLRRFPTNMETKYPITLIDTEILDDWFARPSVWDMLPNLQHAQRVLALVHYMLPTPYKGQPAIVFGASFIFIPTYLRDGLTFLKNAKEDSVVLVATPAKPTYSPQPWKSKYLTLLPISSNPDVDRGPLHTFTAAGLPMASKEGHGGDMPMHIKMPFCFGSSKRSKTELMWEPALQRGPLWKNVYYVERNLSGELVKGTTGKPLCQELLINLTCLSGKLEYTPTD